MNINSLSDQVLQITKQTLIKRRPLPKEYLSKYEKILLSPPCYIRLDSFSDQELPGENLNGHIKVTFKMSQPCNYNTWYVEKKDCNILQLGASGSDPSLPVQDFEKIMTLFENRRNCSF